MFCSQFAEFFNSYRKAEKFWVYTWWRKCYYLVRIWELDILVNSHMLCSKVLPIASYVCTWLVCQMYIIMSNATRPWKTDCIFIPLIFNGTSIIVNFSMLDRSCIEIPAIYYLFHWWKMATYVKSFKGKSFMAI